MNADVLLERRTVKGKRGLNITVEVLKHPCIDQLGGVAYYAFEVRWRDREPFHQIEVRPDWQQKWTTNISTVETIKAAFRDQDYGVRPERVLAKMIQAHIPHERVSQ